MFSRAFFSCFQLHQWVFQIANGYFINDRGYSNIAKGFCKIAKGYYTNDEGPYKLAKGLYTVPFGTDKKQET